MASQSSMSNCSICLENLQPDDETFRHSACGNVFHYSCYDQWMEEHHENARCPFCRRRTRAEYRITERHLAEQERIEERRTAGRDASAKREQGETDEEVYRRMNPEAQEWQWTLERHVMVNEFRAGRLQREKASWYPHLHRLSIPNGWWPSFADLIQNDRTITHVQVQQPLCVYIYREVSHELCKNMTYGDRADAGLVQILTNALRLVERSKDRFFKVFLVEVSQSPRPQGEVQFTYVQIVPKTWGWDDQNNFQGPKTRRKRHEILDQIVESLGAVEPSDEERRQERAGEILPVEREEVLQHLEALHRLVNPYNGCQLLDEVPF